MKSPPSTPGHNGGGFAIALFTQTHTHTRVIKKGRVIQIDTWGCADKNKLNSGPGRVDLALDPLVFIFLHLRLLPKMH